MLGVFYFFTILTKLHILAITSKNLKCKNSMKFLTVGEALFFLLALSFFKLLCTCYM